VERVVYHFLEALTRVGRPDQEYVVLFDRQPPREIARDLPGEFVVVPTRFPLLQRLADLWIAWQVRETIRRNRIDAFLSPNTKFPFCSAARFTTVHGLEWHHCPQEYRASERLRQWGWFQLASRFSNGIITFALNTDADMRRLRPDCEIRTCVVPEGINPIYRRLPASERSLESVRQLGIEPPYVLSVCSLEPRKNLDALVRAFAAVADDHGRQHSLVLVGRAGWKSSRLDALACELGVRDRVLLPGYVSDELLVQIYNHADLFVYPSKYEGFGLPLLEAMACGVPVVTSNGSALAEVAGGAALLVDPHSDADIAAGLDRGLRDDRMRAELRAAGFERARHFSWDEMARTICSFIDTQTKRNWNR
jgi:glycosyltransferase involved in cell wall biosynthesis